MNDAHINKACWQETPLLFHCEQEHLLGIVCQPLKPTPHAVVIVVGGPQYRAGSHRQFTLLARQLAEQGIASIRFDYRGMGDSTGDMRYFEAVDADIRAAIDALQQQLSELKHIALWGLCDAASAALYYAAQDRRVTQLVLLNPWVHSPAGAAKARLKYYYLSRVMQRSFWQKLLSGKVRLRESAQDMSQAKQVVSEVPSDPRHGSPGYIDRMLQGLNQFQGEVLFILSGNDMVAKEFLELRKQHKGWKKTLGNRRISWQHLKTANHTFSTAEWRNQAGAWTAAWLLKKSI